MALMAYEKLLGAQESYENFRKTGEDFSEKSRF